MAICWKGFGSAIHGIGSLECCIHRFKWHANNLKTVSKSLRNFSPSQPLRTAMTKAFDRERRVALAAVAEASAMTRRLQTEMIIDRTQSKADASPVTVADYAVQALIVHHLRGVFPEDLFIAEESSAALRKDDVLCKLIVQATGLKREEVLECISECEDKGEGGMKKDGKRRTWIMDPIDGTRGYIGLRQYCIALGLLQANEIQMGILGCPRLPYEKDATENVVPGGTGTENSNEGVLFYAVRGQGTFMLRDVDNTDEDDGHVRCTVSEEGDAKWALFCESVESAHSSHELSARIAGILGVNQAPMRMDSQAKYGCMARGDASIFMRFPKGGYVENIWDVAPASIVIEEAGGKVTDGRGKKLNYGLGRVLDNQDGIVATNGRLHSQVIDAVQQALREREQ